MAFNPTNPNGQTTSANSAPVVIASNQSAVPVTGNQTTAQSTSWTSATAVNTANSISVTNLNTVSVAMSNTSTMTAGVLTFEVSPDGGTTWFAIAMARIDSYTVETSYTLNTVTNRAWTSSVDSFTNFRVRLSTLIGGTGTATVIVGAQTFAIEPIATVGQATASNLNATVTGTVNISSLVSGVAATSLGKAEDAVHASGDTGVMALAVRNDNAATSMTSTNGDYGSISVDTNGTQFVKTAPAITPTQTSVAGSASSVSILASNAARRGATITNDSSAIMYLKLGTTASTTSYTVSLAGAASAPFAYYEVPFNYTGAIDAIWASATGNARITEIA